MTRCFRTGLERRGAGNAAAWEGRRAVFFGARRKVS